MQLIEICQRSNVSDFYLDHNYPSNRREGGIIKKQQKPFNQLRKRNVLFAVHLLQNRFQVLIKIRKNMMISIKHQERSKQTNNLSTR